MEVPAALVGIIVPALHGIRLITEDVRRIVDAPAVIKSLTEDLQSLDNTLGSLRDIEENEWRALGKNVAEQSATAVSTCTAACETFRSDLQRWTKRSSGGRLSWRDRAKVGLFREQQVRAFSEHLQSCKLACNNVVGVATLYSSMRTSRGTDKIADQVAAQQVQIKSLITTTDTRLAEVVRSVEQLSGSRRANEDDESEDKESTLAQLEEQLAALKSAQDLFTELLSRAETGRPQTPPLPFYILPFRRDDDFIECGDLLDQINTKVSQRAARVAIVGLGGIGKSQLAIEYCYRLRERSPETWVLWIHASNAARFEQGMREIADLVRIRGRDDPTANIFHLVRNWLHGEKSGRWMLVLDNVDDAGFLLEPGRGNRGLQASSKGTDTLLGYLPICDHGSILITTRSETAARKLVESRDMIIVSTMNDGNAISLLKKKLGDRVDITDASDLARELENMPLALTQAAAYLTQKGGRYTVHKYIEKLRKSDTVERSIADEDMSDVRRDHEARNSIFLAWQISFEHVRKIRPSAAGLLSLMSFCDRQAIPEALVRQPYGDGDTDAQHTKRDHDDMNDKLGGGSRDVDDSGSAGEISDESDDMDEVFDRDVTILEGYSFVSSTTDRSVFEMHRLVQLATRKWLKSQGQLEHWKEQYIDNLCTLFPPGSYEYWPVCRVYYPHARMAAELKPQGREAVLKWASVMCNAAEYAWRRVSGNDAETMALLSTSARKELLGDHDVKTLSSQAILALVWADAGRWEEAEKLQVQVLEARKKVLGEEHSDTLTSMEELAETYGDRGRWPEAEILQKHVVQKRMETSPTDHAAILKSESALVWTYYKQGRLPEARGLGEDVQEKMLEHLDERHPDVLVNTAYLGAVYEELHMVDQALAYKERVLRIRKQDLGSEHNLTIISMVNLALTYRRQGMLAKAEELEVDALEKRRRLLGPNHPSTLTSMNNLAWTWRKQGRREKARKLMDECITASIIQLGSEHEKTLQRLDYAPGFGINRNEYDLLGQETNARL